MMGAHHEKGVFWPVFIILVGTAILLVNLGVLPPETAKFWPVIFIILGLLDLVGIGKGEKKK